jgi:hypothetical protein
MRSRRVSANRRHENQESGDYFQDIFIQCSEGVVFNYPVG